MLVVAKMIPEAEVTKQILSFWQKGSRLWSTLLATYSLCYNPSDSEEVIQLFAYLNIVQIIVSAVLIVAILLQSKGEGFSGTFSADTSVFRTRRGVEKTLFQFTIGLAVVFIVLSIISVLAASGVSTSSGVPTP